jgi:hypothetical protein
MADFIDTGFLVLMGSVSLLALGGLTLALTILVKQRHHES